MMLTIFISLFFFSYSHAQATDVFACIPRTSAQSSKEAVQQLEQSQGTKLGEKDLLTRLVFAETLNTNYFLNPKCAEQGPLIAKAIAWGVMNRVRSSGRTDWNSVRKAAFASHQFAPAVSAKSIFSDLFTCPTLLKQSMGQMNEKMSEQKNRFVGYAKKINRMEAYEKYVPLTFKYAKSAVEDAFSYDAGHNPFLLAKVPSPVLNFYYPLSDDAKYGDPDWNRCNQPLDNIDIDGKRLNPECVRFFHEKQVNNTRCPASEKKAPKKPTRASKPVDDRIVD